MFPLGHLIVLPLLLLVVTSLLLTKLQNFILNKYLLGSRAKLGDDRTLVVKSIVVGSFAMVDFRPFRYLFSLIVLAVRGNDAKDIMNRSSLLCISSARIKVEVQVDENSVDSNSSGVSEVADARSLAAYLSSPSFEQATIVKEVKYHLSNIKKSGLSFIASWIMSLISVTIRSISVEFRTECGDGDAVPLVFSTPSITACFTDLQTLTISAHPATLLQRLESKLLLGETKASFRLGLHQEDDTICVDTESFEADCDLEEISPSNYSSAAPPSVSLDSNDDANALQFLNAHFPASEFAVLLQSLSIRLNVRSFAATLRHANKCSCLNIGGKDFGFVAASTNGDSLSSKAANVNLTALELNSRSIRNENALSPLGIGPFEADLVIQLEEPSGKVSLSLSTTMNPFVSLSPAFFEALMALKKPAEAEPVEKARTPLPSNNLLTSNNLKTSARNKTEITSVGVTFVFKNFRIETISPCPKEPSKYSSLDISCSVLRLSTRIECQSNNEERLLLPSIQLEGRGFAGYLSSGDEEKIKWISIGRVRYASRVIPTLSAFSLSLSLPATTLLTRRRRRRPPSSFAVSMPHLAIAAPTAAAVSLKLMLLPILLWLRFLQHCSSTQMFSCPPW